MVFKVGASWTGYSFSFSAILIWGQLFTIVLWSVVQHATCAVDLYRIKAARNVGRSKCGNSMTIRALPFAMLLSTNRTVK